MKSKNLIRMTCALMVVLTLITVQAYAEEPETDPGTPLAETQVQESIEADAYEPSEYRPGEEYQREPEQAVLESNVPEPPEPDPGEAAATDPSPAPIQPASPPAQEPANPETEAITEVLAEILYQLQTNEKINQTTLTWILAVSAFQTAILIVIIITLVWRN